MQELTIRADKPIMYPELDDNGRFVRFSHTPDSTEFSISRAVRAMVSRDTRSASAEFDFSSAMAKRVGKLPAPHGFYAPASALFRMVKTTSPAFGSNLVPSEHLGDLYAHVLREQSLVGRLGMRTIPSDGGDLAIPKGNASSTAYWLADEDTAITESSPSFAQIELSPKFVAGYVTVSQRLLKQSSPAVDQLLEEDLRGVVGEAIDRAIIQGTAANGQPRGILNTSGIGSLSMGSGETTGVSDLLDMQKTVAAAKAYRGSLRYLLHPNDAALLAQRQRFTSTNTPLYDGDMTSGQILGVPAVVSTFIPQGTILFGDYSEAFLASWSALELLVDPFSNSQNMAVSIRVMAAVDVGVRRPESFVKLTLVV